MSRHKKNLIGSFFVFLLTTFCLPPLQAIEDDEEKEKKENYYIVVEEKLDVDFNLTATKLPISTQLVPASIGVVTEQVLDAQDATYLSDALKNFSGVNVQNGFGAFDFFLVRGFDSLSSSLILTDGAPEPEITFYPLYNVERVEVFKGPGAFLYGGNPLSGTVQLVRKQASSKDRLEFHSAYGSFQSFSGTMDYNEANDEGDIAFRFNGLGSSSDNYRDDKENHLVAINPTVTFRNWKFNFEYTNNEFKPDSGIPILGDEIADVPRERSYQTPFDTSNQDIYRARVDYTQSLGKNWRVRNKFYYTDLAWLSNGTLILGAFPNGFGGFAVFRTQPRLDDRQKLIGNQLDFSGEFDTGNFHHTILAGFELSRLGDEFTLDVAALPPIDLLNPVETATDPPFLIPGQSQSGDSRSIVFAPYVVDQLSVTEQLKLFVGARFDQLDFEDQLTSTKRDEHQVSPLIGVTFSPNRQLTFYANAGKAFAPPSSLVVGPRKPEKTVQYEAGVKKSFNEEKIRTSLAFYHLQKENIAIPDSTGVTRQIGDQSSFGIETEVSGQFAKGWETILAYAYNDSKLDKFAESVFTGQNFLILDWSGNKPPFTPEHILNLWVLRKMPNGLWFGGGPRYVSNQFISEDNQFKIDDYLIFDAYISYGTPKWRCSLNFKNVTNRDYETRGFGRSSVIPANPFSFDFGVDFKL